MPGGTGKFSALIIDFSGPGYPVLDAGTVVFAGRDSASSGYTGGLYSVPAVGGAITRIVNRDVAIPGGGGNFAGGLQYFDVSAGKAAFYGVGGSTSGIYSANTNGTALSAIADTMHPAHPEFIFPIGNFNFPSISGSTVAFYGNGVFDPSTGYNALYTSPATGGFAYGEPANSGQALPGDPTVAFHTRFGRPFLDGSTIFFRADDTNTNPNHNGIYSVPLAGGALSKIVDVNDTLPGLTGIDRSNSFTLYSADAGLVAFTPGTGATISAFTRTTARLFPRCWLPEIADRFPICTPRFTCPRSAARRSITARSSCVWACAFPLSAFIWRRPWPRARIWSRRFRFRRSAPPSAPTRP